MEVSSYEADQQVAFNRAVDQAHVLRRAVLLAECIAAQGGAGAVCGESTMVIAQRLVGWSLRGAAALSAAAEAYESNDITSEGYCTLVTAQLNDCRRSLGFEPDAERVVA